MKKIYKILLVGFLVFITIVIFSINSIVKNILISTVKEKTGKDISISSLWINPFSGNISAKGINLLDEDNSIFSLQSFKLDSAPMKLAKGILYIDEITLIEPTINIGKMKSKEEKVPSTETSKNNSESSEVSTTIPEQEETPLKTAKKESFIKEVIVKNITVENLVLEGGESQLKSLNTFTLEVPNFVYKDDTLNLSAILEIIDSGSLDLNVTANTQLGDLEGSITSNQLLLNSSFNHNKEVFNTEATFKGNIDFSGNYIEKNITTKGFIELKDIKVSDSNNTPLLLSKNIDIKLEELSYPDLKIISAGTFKVDITSEIIPILLKDNPDIKIGFQGGSINGGFTLNYPILDVKSTIIAEEIIVQDTEKLPYKGTLKILEGNYNLSLDILNKLTTLTGVTNLNTLDFADTKNNSLFFRGGQADINYTSTKDTSDILIKNMQFSKGEALVDGNKLKDISLDISNITDKKIDSPLVFSATGDDFTKISADIKISAEDLEEFSDLEVSGNLNIDTLKLGSIKKFVEDLPYEMNGVISYTSYIDYSKDNITSVGSVSGKNLKMIDKDMNISMENFNSTMDITMKEDDIISIGKVSGTNFKIVDKDMDLSINNFNSTLDLIMKKDILTLNNTVLVFENVKGKVDKETTVSLPTGKVSIKKYTAEDININNFTLNNPVIISYKVSDAKPKSSASSSSKVTQKTDTSKVAKTKVVEESAKLKKDTPLPNLYIGSLNINNATYTETDGSKKTTYRDINFVSRNFNSRKGKEFTVDGSTSLDGIQGVYLKGKTTLTKDWEFDPKTIKFNGTLGVGEVTLSHFNDTLSKSLPNKIERGTLSSTGSLKLNKGLIDSQNKIKLSDLKLGESTGLTSKIPLSKVIDALKGNNGDINIDVPVKGDLNDPEFGVTEIVLNALIANFSNILKNPEKAISNILTIGSSNKEGVVYFDYLDSRPKSSDIEKLDKTLELMKSNPSSKLKVTLFTNDKVEEGIMKGKDLASSLFGKKKESSSNKLEELMEKRKNYILNYLTPEIESNRIEITISDRDKSLPQAKLELQ